MYILSMNDKNTLSIKDIARLSGVSVATVSHVLNKKGRYSKETEEKVNRIIRQYGYRMNNAAKSLKSSSSHTVGLIIPSINNDFFSTIASTVETWFDERDYSLFICNTNNDPDKEIRYFRRLDAMQVDGILCISCQRMLDSTLLTRDIPVLLIDRKPINNQDLCTVASDAEDGIYTTTKTLIERGCRNILFVSSFLATYVSTSRKDGYLRAMQEYQLPAGEETVLQLPKGMSLQTAEVAIVDYVQSGKPVDAVVCTSDNQAIGVMTGLKRLGISIPDDVKVTGFDNQFQSQICTPTLSTIARDPYSLAVIASGNMYKLIQGDADIERHVVLKTRLIERESTQMK